MRIYIMVLDNPDASDEGKQGARDDLMRLAREVDTMNAKKD